MEKSVTTAPQLIQWLEQVRTVPLAFAEADQADVLETDPRPLLELVLVVRGVFTLEVGKVRQEVGPGDVAWINAHHGNRANLADSGARYACLSLEVGHRREFRAFGRRPVLEVMRGPSLEWTWEAFSEAVRWHRATDDPLREPMLRAALVRLLGNLAVAGERAAGVTRPAPLIRALAVLERNSAEADLTLETVARGAGVSGSTLRRLFVEHLKMTPIDYLQSLRLARARDLLAKTSLEIKEVAARVGYADPLYFSKAFKRRHGVSPSQVQGGRRKSSR